MCDERERLLDYVYDACDASERRTIEAHLEGCEDCRGEISGLRTVRLDLLAWHVPKHDSVWKPFAPARVAPWYREVPAWALVAAATVMFMLGLAGGVVSRQLLPAQSAVAKSVPPAVVATPTLPPDLTSAQITAMEQRIMKAVDSRLSQPPQPVAAHGRLQPVGMSRQEVLSLTGNLEERQRETLRANNMRLLRDSDRMYLTRSQFDEWVRNVRYEIQALAAQQQQGH